MPTTNMTTTNQDVERGLEQKYAAVISLTKQLGARIEKSHVENNKLVLRILAPSDQAKSKIWDQVKTVDKDFSDLSLDIRVDETEGGGLAESAGQRTYTVKRGDTLSELAQKFYGNASQYNKIFDANRDQLKDADHIEIGQTLKIPE